MTFLENLREPSEEIATWMADRTLLTEGQARAALSDVAEAA
jgi:hypothetical protein